MKLGGGNNNKQWGKAIQGNVLCYYQTKASSPKCLYKVTCTSSSPGYFSEPSSPSLHLQRLLYRQPQTAPKFNSPSSSSLNTPE